LVFTITHLSVGFDAQTGADREVQRVLLELLNQMDGFDQSVNVKVIMATNRGDTLDPALLRPGRLDRKIEFPLPDRRQKRLIFSAITSKMNLSDEVDLEDCLLFPFSFSFSLPFLITDFFSVLFQLLVVARPDRLSGADISAICQEAGMQAVRKNRYVILTKDFEKVVSFPFSHRLWTFLIFLFFSFLFCVLGLQSPHQEI